VVSSLDAWVYYCKRSIQVNLLCLLYQNSVFNLRNPLLCCRISRGTLTNACEMAGPDDLGVSHTERSTTPDASGSEKTDGINVTADGTVVDHGLHRALKKRHLEMIALGGVIG
jgi:hypothetical protein